MQLIDLLQKRSELLRLIGKNAEAQIDQQKALSIARKTRNRQKEADCLLMLCAVYESLSRFPDIKKSSMKARRIYIKIKDKKGLWRSYMVTGVACLHLNEWKNSLNNFHHSLKIAEDLNDAVGISNNLNNIGMVFESLDNNEESLKYYMKALAIEKKNNFNPEIAATLHNISNIHKRQGGLSKSIKYVGQALQLNRKIGNRRLYANNLITLGNINIIRSDMTDAVENFQEALAIYKDVGFRIGEAVACSNLGLVHYIRCQYKKALDCFERMVAIMKETRSPVYEAIGLRHIALIEQQLGNYSNARSLYEEALGITSRYGKLSTHLDCHNDLGNLLINTGDLSNAGKHLDKSLKITREKKLLDCLYFALQNSALLALERNKISRAKEYHREMVSITEKINTLEMKAGTLFISGQIQLKEKQWQPALSFFNKALCIYETMENPYGGAQMKYYIGLTFSMSGQKGEAEKWLSEALNIFKKIGAGKQREKVEKALANV